jgi:cyclophilin family peptidyl-prolyl cis-trans isomerase
MGLLGSSSLSLRSAAIRSLGRIDAKVAAPQIAGILDEHPDVRTRVRIADAMGRLGVESTWPTLRRLLADPDFGVRETTLRAIARTKARSLVADVMPLRSDPSVAVRAAAYECCAILLEKDCLDVIRRGLDDDSPLVVAATLEQLGRSREPEVPTLLRVYLQQRDHLALRAAATTGLARLGDRAPLPELRNLLADPDWVSACIAATALGELDDKAAVEALIDALSRSGPGSTDVRLAAVESLGMLGDTSAENALRVVMRVDHDVRVRLAAREALEKFLDDVSRAHLPTEESIRYDVRPVTRSEKQPPLVARSQAAQLILHTDRGRIVMDLFGEDAPQMVENFARLAEKKFFDGLDFHRVVPDFVIQGGDPMGNGWGDPGYTVRSEFSRRHFDRGTVGVAHSGKDTGGCQFFVTLSRQHHLDARYTIIGKVVTGMDVVDQIDRGDRFTAEVKWRTPEH